MISSITTVILTLPGALDHCLLVQFCLANTNYEHDGAEHWKKEQFFLAKHEHMHAKILQLWKNKTGRGKGKVVDEVG